MVLKSASKRDECIIGERINMSHSAKASEHVTVWSTLQELKVMETVKHFKEICAVLDAFHEFVSTLTQYVNALLAKLAFTVLSKL